MSRITLIGLLICFGLSISMAQDTAKKKTVAKPADPKYKTYKNHIYGYHHYHRDSVAAHAAAIQPTAKPDSAAAATTFTDKSLNGQYQYLLSKVYHYQQPLISALWKNASDTLNANRSKLKAAVNKLGLQAKTIDSLNSEVADAAAANTRVNGIDVFGILLSKTTYNLVVWGLVALFGIIAIVVIARSGSHRREARYRIQLYNELEDEFKAFKTKANDKEKKLARELQTERNKLDDLLGK